MWLYTTQRTHRKLLNFEFWINDELENSKFNHFLGICWFLCKNLSNFVPPGAPAWKLHNPYCHTQHCFIGLVLLHSATKTLVNDSSGLIHFLMCFFLCPATEESDRMSESGGYLRFDNFFNCLHFNGNHHQLKTYGEFLLFLEKSGDLPAKTNCVLIYIFITYFCFKLFAVKVKIVT